MVKKRRFRDIKKGIIPHQKIEDRETILDNNYAPIGTKIKAFITDIFMLLMPLMYIVTYLVLGSLQEFSEHKVDGWLYILIPNFIIVFLFFWKSGQTPGCRAYAIKLVDAETLEKAHPLAIALRYYFELLSIVSIIGIIIPFFRKDNRALHDILSGTVLIKTDQEKTLKQ